MDACRRSGMTLERLLEVNNKITALLGRTINMREHSVKAFRKRIGEYADSHNKKDEIQPWPLVKVYKLRHNWQVSVAVSTCAFDTKRRVHDTRSVNLQEE